MNNHSQLGCASDGIEWRRWKARNTHTRLERRCGIYLICVLVADSGNLPVGLGDLLLRMGEELIVPSFGNVYCELASLDGILEGSLVHLVILNHLLHLWVGGAGQYQDESIETTLISSATSTELERCEVPHLLILGVQIRKRRLCLLEISLHLRGHNAIQSK